MVHSYTFFLLVYDSFPGKFHRSILSNTPWGKAGMNYSLLCLHTVFDGSEMEAVMGPRTSYVTMLRDPIEVFESQYSFYDFSGFYGISLGRMRTTLEINISIIHFL